MSDLFDLLALLVLLAIVGSWLKLSRAREQAIDEARRQCRQHGLQLLDESVGLRRLRLQRATHGWLLERGYDFEVSIDGNDREPGSLWMTGDTLTGVRLPTIEAHVPELAAAHQPARALPDNVVPLRPRDRLH